MCVCVCVCVCGGIPVSTANGATHAVCVSVCYIVADFIL